MAIINAQIIIDRERIEGNKDWNQSLSRIDSQVGCYLNLSHTCSCASASFVQVLSLYVIYPYVDKINNITKLYK